MTRGRAPLFLLTCLTIAVAATRVSAQTPPSDMPPAPPNPTSSLKQVPLTLEQAEAIAIRNNPQITVGKLNALVSWQYVREARSYLMPTLETNMTAATSEDNSRITAGFLNSPRVLERVGAGVSMTQLITDFGRTQNLISSSIFQAKSQNQNAIATTADIVLAVDQAFYNALETQALVTVAQETVKARQDLVDQIQALTNAKLRSDLDLSFTKVDFERAELLLIESQNNYQTALAGLSAILGYNDEQNFKLVEENINTTTPSPTVEALIAEAMQQRPEIASLQNQLQAAVKNASAEHDLWRPTVNAMGDVGITPVRSASGLIPSSWYGGVGVNVNIPIFNGFLFNARAKAADLQTQANQQRLKDMQDNISRDVRIAWENTVRAYQRLFVTRQLQEQANLALDLAKQRYDLGLSSIVEFSQAVLGKTEADITNTDARYRYRVSQIVLAYSIAGPK